jgi:ribosomal protein S18 acetylase RimI-like enzyme
MDGIEIATGTAADIPRLEPLWVSVHHQHVASMPELAPYVSDEITWRERRALYEDLFGKPDTFLLLAREADRLVGYALVHTMPASETWVGDTWVTGPVIAELESIAVLPDRRGAGIGSALLDEVDRILQERGIDDVVLGALPGNEDAIRLYERRGFRPTWLYLSRFRRS